MPIEIEYVTPPPASATRLTACKSSRIARLTGTPSVFCSNATRNAGNLE